MAISHQFEDYPAQVVIKSFVTKPLELTSPTLQLANSFPSSPIIPHSRYPASSTLASYDEAYESYDDDSEYDDDDDTRSVFSDCGSVVSSVSSAPEDEAEPFQVIDYSSGFAVPVMVYASLEQAVRLSTQRAEAEVRRQEAMINEVHTVASTPTTRSPSSSFSSPQPPPFTPGAAAAETIDSVNWNSPGAASTYAEWDEDEDAFFSMG